MEFAVPQSKIGGLITDSVKRLLDARRLQQGRFTDSDDNWGAGDATGPFTSMQGIRTVLGAITALADDADADIWSVVGPELQSIFDEWREVLSELEREGYAARPYDRGSAALAEILKEAGAGRTGAGESYVDMLSWSVSTAVLFNYTARVLHSHRRMSVSSPLIDSTRQEIARALTTLLDAQCADGGWGWARGAEVGHLYFTWSAVEGLADYLDYVLGESEEKIGIAADHEVVKWLEENYPQLRSRVEAARKNAVDFLEQRYLGKALSGRLELEDLTIDKRLEPADRKHSRLAIYYELYLLESLILLSYDLPGGIPSPPHRAKLATLYDRLGDELAVLASLPPDDDFWRDADASTLRFKILSKKMLRGEPHAFLVQDPGLWPQFLRTMILYRFYTDPGTSPDPRIVGKEKSSLRYLIDDRREAGEGLGDGLWDKVAFNLAITARSIEALIDVYDYYGLLAQKAAPARPLIDGDLAATIAEAVYPHLAARLLASLPSPPAAVAEAEEIDAVDLQRELRAFVRKDTASFSEPLRRLLGDALFPIKEWDGGPPREQVVEEFLGIKAAHELRDVNSDAYDLLGQLVWLNFCSIVRLLPMLLSESIMAHSSEKEDVLLLRRIEADATKGHQKLADRLKLAMQEILKHEANTAAKRPGEPPSYEEILRALFQAPAAKGKVK